MLCPSAVCLPAGREKHREWERRNLTQSIKQMPGEPVMCEQIEQSVPGKVQLAKSPPAPGFLEAGDWALLCAKFSAKRPKYTITFNPHHHPARWILGPRILKFRVICSWLNEQQQE